MIAPRATVPRPHLVHRIAPAATDRRPAEQKRKGVGTIAYSFVVPLKDEQATIIDLYERIAAQIIDGETFEVVFIDDGSQDHSWETIEALVASDPERVRGIRFRRNVGKAAALTAGFRAARGRVVFTLDADLQDDPKEIRRFLERLAEGYDLVTGWKKVRHDPLHKVLPSRVFNWMLSRCSGVRLHDHNCGFKCYRAEVAKSLTLFGELHRMVPAIAAMNGFKVAEIVVEHHARRHGVSKYGFERYLRGFTDMLMMGFLRKYRDRPSHFIAGVAVACGFLATTLLVLGVGLMAAGHGVYGVAAVTSGTVLLGTGILGTVGCLIAEIANRGGLRAGWSLPIAADTLTTTETPRSRMPTAAPISAAFAVEG